jgi:hypothetical protein
MEEAFQALLNALQRSRIPYMVGGSLASSLHGIPRSTNDVDIVADIREEHVSRFVSGLAGTFYADSETIREAVRHGQSFNVIHYATSSKFDIFPAAGSPYIETQIERSTAQDLPVGEGLTIRCPVATAEDILLAKLLWYRMGGEQSDQQWNDVRGIRSVQGTTLDRIYLERWAQHLKVDDLLARLFAEEEPE